MAWNPTGGNLKGPQGEPGKDGAKGDAGNSLHVADVTVSANSDIATSALHPNTTFSVGDVVSDVDGVLYSITSIVNTTTVHVGARIDDVTLKGPQGPQGEKGADGTGVNIKGSYDTVEELEAAHPTGESGDAYLVAGSLYVWDVDNSKWTNVGDIKGPKGDTGDKGADGVDGTDGIGWTYGHGTPTGDQPIGSLYLNLDTGDVYAYTA